MPHDIEFNYINHIDYKSYEGHVARLEFDPPVPAVLVELRSPESPNNPHPVRVPALIDSGAGISLIPWILVMELRLRKVDDVQVGDYNAVKDEDFRILPVYWVHLTIPSFESIHIQVAPKKPESHVTIGRNIINDLLLTLNGPELKGLIRT